MKWKRERMEIRSLTFQRDASHALMSVRSLIRLNIISFIFI